MTAAEVLEAAQAAGVRLYLVDGCLRGKARPGAYNNQLKALVAQHREAIIAHLVEQQSQLDAALAEVERLTADAGPKTGRSRVLGHYLDLAQRWHKAGDVMLLQLPDDVRHLLARWRDEGELSATHARAVK